MVAGGGRTILLVVALPAGLFPQPTGRHRQIMEGFAFAAHCCPDVPANALQAIVSRLITVSLFRRLLFCKVRLAGLWLSGGDLAESLARSSGKALPKKLLADCGIGRAVGFFPLAAAFPWTTPSGGIRLLASDGIYASIIAKHFSAKLGILSLLELEMGQPDWHLVLLDLHLAANVLRHGGIRVWSQRRLVGHFPHLDSGHSAGGFRILLSAGEAVVKPAGEVSYGINFPTMDGTSSQGFQTATK